MHIFLLFLVNVHDLMDHVSVSPGGGTDSMTEYQHVNGFRAGLL